MWNLVLPVVRVRLCRLVESSLLMRRQVVCLQWLRPSILKVWKGWLVVPNLCRIRTRCPCAARTVNPLRLVVTYCSLSPLVMVVAALDFEKKLVIKLFLPEETSTTWLSRVLGPRAGHLSPLPPVGLAGIPTLAY